MKQENMSKLAKELHKVYQTTHQALFPDGNAITAGCEAEADYVRKLVERAADAASSELFVQTPAGHCCNNTEMKRAVMGVLPKDEPLSPFGCKCWTQTSSGLWARPLCGVYLDPIDWYCRFCGAKRQEQP